MFLLICISAIFLYSLWILLRKPINHPIDQFPGPPTVPFFGTLFILLNKKRHEIFKMFNEIAKKYPKIYRTWMTKFIPIIHPLDPDYVERILSSTDNISKSFDYDILSEWLGYGLLTSTGGKWHSRRKLLTTAFHFNILEQFISVMNDKCKILIKKFDKGTELTSVDITPLVTKCALDIICQTAMGINVNAQDENVIPYVSAVYEINDLFIYRALRPWLYPRFIFKLTQPGQKFENCLKILHNFTDKVIAERREILKNPTNKSSNEASVKKIRVAFLDLLLKASDQDPSLTNSEIRSEVDTFMFEGHDTTAMAMSWALFMLGIHDDIQEKCRDELYEIFGNDTDKEITMNDLNKMKYLERVIKEALRLRPSVITIARKLDKNVLFDGFDEITAKTTVHVNIYNIHRNPDIFPEPEKFDPDRFSPENQNGRHPFAYIPFSAGPRNCIGQKFAMLEMKILLAYVLRKFKLKSINPEKYIEAEPDIILRPRFGLPMKITHYSK